MEDLSEMSFDITMPMRWGPLAKFDMQCHNKWTNYSMYKFFKDISDQHSYFGNTKV